MPQSFGRWLLAQAKRDDAIGQLAKDAKRDHGFPADGSVNDVRNRLNALQVDGDLHAAMDDAELEFPTDD